jgi:predicted transcriptional regulator
LEVSLLLIRDEKRRSLIVAALADEFSNRILASAIINPRSVMDLVREHGIPMTSAYRRVKELIDCGLLEVERIVLTNDGKKYDLYRSTVRAINVRFENGVVEVDVTPSSTATEKIMRRFLSLKEAR